MQTENNHPMDKVVTRVVLIALILALGSGTAQAQPDQNKQVYSPGQGGWILYYSDPDVDGWHDPNEAWFTIDPNMNWGPDNSCWMASASNLLVFEGRVSPYFGWLGGGGAASPSPRPWGGQITAGGGGSFMTFDDGGWQHWALDQVGVAYQGPILTTSEFTPGTWAINPVTWCQTRLAEGHLCGLTVYWGKPAPDAIPIRVDPEKAESTGYHAITLIDITAGTITITDSDDLVAGSQQFSYTWDGTDWIIKDLYYSPDPNAHVKEAHVNYAVALQAKLGSPTTITYQGRLKDGGSPVDGEYDFQFKLFDDPSVVLGNQVGPTITKEDIDLAAGTFTVRLDFGSGVFTGDCRWLEIGVRPGNSTGAFTMLSPLQELTRTPYAIYADTAGSISGGITGGGTSGYIAKFINPNTIGDSVIYESAAGHIGIGTNSPGSSLTITGLVESLSGGYKFPDGSIQTTASSGDGHSLDAADGIPLDVVYVDNDGEVGIGTSSPGSPLTVAGLVESLSGGYKFPDGTIQTTASLVDGHSLDAADGIPLDVVYVDNDGKVGIGTTSPTEAVTLGNGGALQINSAGNDKYLQLYHDDTDSRIVGSSGDIYVTPPLSKSLYVRPVTPGIGYHNPQTAIDVYVNHGGDGYGTIKAINAKAWTNSWAGDHWDRHAELYGIYAHAENVRAGGNSTFNSYGVYGKATGTYHGTTTACGIYGTASGADDNWAGYFDDGDVYVKNNVGIGTTNPAYKLDVNGDIQCVALHETSDARLKTNVRQLTGMLEKIDKVRGISFEWNEAAEAIGATAGQDQIGIVAQELEAILPELVSTPEDGYKSVDYTKLTAVLVEAIKELKLQNQELERRIDVLERTVQCQQCNR